MRTGVTIGTRHGGKRQEIISGENVSLPDQVEEFKANQLSKTHPDFERIEVWDNDSGRVKSARFLKPDKAKKE